MHRTPGRGRRASTVLWILLACVLLAACGSSGEPAATNANKGKSSALSALSGSSQNKVFKEALTKYAGCLRAHGVDVPNPSSSTGSKASLDTKGIDTSSRRFKRAAASCTKTLNEALRTAAAKAYAPKGSAAKS
jgi:hypothetical protein